MTKLAKAEGDYVLRRVTHSATRGNAYRSGESGAFEYTNHFQAIPFALPFSPPRVTPKPVVAGSQTAVVVGPAGEEIFTDKYSRIKVQFHWDRQGKSDADSSCWVRVASQWAGKQWGFISIPRIGQEVVVDFLEGDPDLPIVTGSVYNAEQMPPYALPGNKTQSGVKSRSSMGGNPETFNEIFFEDKKGSELVYIRAEKDQTLAVENDEAHWVGHDRDKTVDNDERVLIHHDRTKTVDNNETNTIGVDRKEKVGSNETIDIGASRTETVGKHESISVKLTRTRLVGLAETVTVGGAQAITVGAARAVTVGLSQAVTVAGNQTESVGGTQKETYGKDHGQTVAQNQSVTVGNDQSSKVGKNRTAEVAEDDGLKVGKKLVISAGEEILIKTGDASILMKKDGTIQISGKDVTVKASGEMNHKADKNITMKGQKILQN
jgi:type VI secretion system secreted protein VgrG